MGKGFLKVELFTGDHVLPVKDAEVIIKDHSGNVRYRLKADQNGICEKVALEAPDIPHGTESNAETRYFSVYDVEVPPYNGYMRKIIHDVQIFDNITSVLPVQMYPAVTGDTQEENTDEIFIPYDHGVNIPRTQMPISDAESENTAMAIVPLANEVKVPDYITVHLGSPKCFKGIYKFLN